MRRSTRGEARATGRWRRSSRRSRFATRSCRSSSRASARWQETSAGCSGSVATSSRSSTAPRSSTTSASSPCPDEILSKPGPLDEREWAFVRQHTIVGERILRASPALRSVATIVRASHENWDGSGYPDGLAGEDIPLASRIIRACNAFVAMTSHSAVSRGALRRRRAERARCAAPVVTSTRTSSASSSRASGTSRKPSEPRSAPRAY